MTSTFWIEANSAVIVVDVVSSVEWESRLVI